MNKRIFQSCLPGLLLLSASMPARACSSGSATIMALAPESADSYVVTALSSAGLMTGYFYGSQQPHAFKYSGGALNDLGTLGGVISEGFSINSSGQITGVSYTTNNAQLNAFLFDGSTLSDLGTLGGPYSSASLINDAGMVAGVSLLPGASETTAFIYSQGVMTSLGTLGGTYSSAFALNNVGQVVGESSIANGDSHAFVSIPGGILDLGTLGGNYSSAFWINDAGTVVGESALSSSDIHAFISAGGTMTDLGTFGGTYSSAFQVNSNGQVIGIATITNDIETHGFIYSSGVLSDLGTLGGTSVSPYAINNRGQVVGVATLADNTSHAFLWQQNQMVDLNSLLPANSGWELSLAQFINDAGRIVGNGTFNGAPAVFILDLASANNPPIAVAGPDQTVDCQAQVTLNGSSSSDPDHDPLTFEWSSAGTVLGTSSLLTVSLPMGTNVVTLKVTDTCGASNETKLTVIVADTTPPVGSCPASATVSANANCQGLVPDFTAQVVATDNCSPARSLVITQNPVAGTSVGLGQHPVTLTVTDPSGNSSSCMVLFTVVDTTAPSFLSGPSPVHLSADAHCQATVPNLLGSVIVSDSCTPDGQIGLAQSPVAGTLLPVGDHTVTITATDAAGNHASMVVLLSIADTTAPTIQSLAVSPNVLSPPNHQLVAVTVSALVTDNCDVAPVTKIVSITCNEVTAPADIQITGNLTATLAAAKASSGNSRIYTLNVQSTDASGNVSTGVVTVSVPKSNGSSGNGNNKLAP
jgi:probable HAF family extracellular repeat protein